MTRAKSSAAQRDAKVVEIIRENPGIHHNELIRVIVCKMNLMAKSTLEKSIERLIKSGEIEVVNDGNKHRYSISEEPVDYDNTVNLKKLCLGVKKSLGLLDRDYHTTSLSTKIERCSAIAKTLILIEIIIQFRWPSSVPSDADNQIAREVSILSRKLMSIIMNDKDAIVVFRNLMARIEPK